ncbi:MAG: tetratricopeptide repeat protein [Bacteroidota bacterium]|nr:tetratricopeptide repeat protein [Bacteroidota bacterium]
MKKLLLLILIFLSVGGIHAQVRNLDNKFRMAQIYESSGDWDNAVKIYEELYAADSLNVVFFDALMRGYDQLKRYSDAIKIINTHLKFRPKDVGLLSQLGKTYLRANDKDKALNAWMSALDVDYRNINSYYIVANAMVESRMIDNAIKVYEKGRSVLNDKFLFAGDIGYLYSISMNYEEATRQYMLLLKQNPGQLGFIQSRISIYTGKPDGLNSATSVVETAYKTDTDNTQLIQLLAWLYMEGKKYDRAFSIFKNLDEKTKAGGREIFNFAERAFRDKAFSTAALAYQELIINYPKSINIPASEFGYARTLEESAAEDDTLKLFGDLKPFATKSSGLNPSYQLAIAAFNKVITNHPNNEFAARSWYRIASINYYTLFDLTKAADALNRIEKNFSNFIPVLFDAAYLSGQVFIAQGELEKAAEKFRWLAETRFAQSDLREKANFAIAETDFLRGNFKDAQQKLQNLLASPNSDIANDAIGLQVLIQENLNNENLLKDFSKGILLKHQRQFSKAAEVLEVLAAKQPEADIVENTLVVLGDVYTMMQQYEKAVFTYERIMKDFPDNVFADKSQLKTAAVYQWGLKNSVKAIEAYQMLLEKYPGSVYVNEARRRIREIRGDVL